MVRERGHNLSRARREAALVFFPLLVYSRRMPDVDMTASILGGIAHYETGRNDDQCPQAADGKTFLLPVLGSVSDSFFERQYGRWDYGEERHLDSEGRLTLLHNTGEDGYRVQVTVLCSVSRFVELAVDGDCREASAFENTHCTT